MGFSYDINMQLPDEINFPAGTGAFLVLFLLIWLLVFGFWIGLYVAAKWKIYEKAGEKGWKALIPLYNAYTEYRLFWQAKYFWWLFAMEAAWVPLSILLRGSAIMTIYSLAVAVVAIVFAVKVNNRMAWVFGHSGWFCAGLFFINYIFVMILGFSHDAFVGRFDWRTGATAKEPEQIEAAGEKEA